MTADVIQLGRRAVACKGWRWMPGMVFLVEESTKWRIQSDNHAVQIHADRIPDFSDPATLGCLASLVREAWGDPYLCCVGDRETGWRIDGYAAVEDIHSFGSEAEALVYALEKAP